MTTSARPAPQDTAAGGVGDPRASVFAAVRRLMGRPLRGEEVIVIEDLLDSLRAPRAGPKKDGRMARLKLVGGWKAIWWRRWSTWLAGLNALFVSYQVLVVGIIGFAPDELRWPLAIGAGLVAFGVPVLVTHIHQPKLERKVKEKRNG